MTAETPPYHLARLEESEKDGALQPEKRQDQYRWRPHVAQRLQSQWQLAEVASTHQDVTGGAVCLAVGPRCLVTTPTRPHPRSGSLPPEHSCRESSLWSGLPTRKEESIGPFRR